LVPAPRHDTFNVGSGSVVSVDELARAIGSATGSPVEVIDAGEEVNPFVVSAPLDLDRAREELGWSPAHDLRSGLDEHAAWLRDALRA